MPGQVPGTRPEHGDEIGGGAEGEEGGHRRALLHGPGGARANPFSLHACFGEFVVRLHALMYARLKQATDFGLCCTP